MEEKEMNFLRDVFDIIPQLIKHKDFEVIGSNEAMNEVMTKALTKCHDDISFGVRHVFWIVLDALENHNEEKLLVILHDQLEKMKGEEKCQETPSQA